MKGAVWVVGWLNTVRESKKCRRLRTNWKKESNPQCKNKTGAVWVVNTVFYFTFE